VTIAGGIRSAVSGASHIGGRRRIAATVAGKDLRDNIQREIGSTALVLAADTDHPRLRNSLRDLFATIAGWAILQRFADNMAIGDVRGKAAGGEHAREAGRRHQTE
jgi:hypothetical protein